MKGPSTASSALATNEIYIYISRPRSKSQTEDTRKQDSFFVTINTAPTRHEALNDRAIAESSSAVLAGGSTAAAADPFVAAKSKVGTTHDHIDARWTRREARASEAVESS